MFSNCKLFLRTITLITFLFISFISYSQNIDSEQQIDSTIVNKPEAIHVINIIQNLESINEEIVHINKKISPQSNILKIDSLYPNQEDLIQKQKLHVENFIKSNPNRQKIDNLIKKWNSHYDYLSDWQSTINQANSRNLILYDEVSFKEKTWELTYQNALEKEIPNDVLHDTKSVWNNLTNVKNTIAKENNDLLLLESKINSQKTIVTEVIDSLIVLKNSKVYNLFYLRHLPIWKSFTKKSNRNPEAEKEEVESINENFYESFQFFKVNQQKIHVYLIIIVIIVLLIRLLRKTFIKHSFNEEDESLQKAKDVILKNYLAVFLFLVLLIAKFFFINAPMLFGDLLIFFILLDSVLLVQPYMLNRFKKVIYFIILFYLMDALKTYIWFSTLQYRIYLLFEAFIVIGSVYYFTHPYLKTKKIKLSKFSLLIIKLTPYIYTLSIISITSNVLGYTNLTDIALKICTQGCVYLIIFYCLLLISNGISTGIIHFHFSSKESYDQQTKLKIERKALVINRVIAFIFWILFFLKMIDLLSPISSYLNDIITEPYQIGSITFNIKVILVFIQILIISYLITHLISTIFDDTHGGGGILKFLNLPKGIPAAISLVLRYFIIGLGFVLAVSSLGIDLSKFNLMAGALGLGIGFGLQTIISNFVSGLILVFERPMLPGDTIEVNNLIGTVSRVGIRSSNISTFDGAEVVVPNNNLISNDLINWTLSDNTKRVEINIGTTYDANPNDVLKILSGAALENNDVLKTPPPIALFNDFGDSSLNYKLLFWVHYSLGLQAKSDVSIIIYNKFKELGIEIPFPQQDIHIKNSSNKTDTNVSTEFMTKLDEDNDRQNKSKE